MIRVANAPCSWGVLEFNLEGEAAGYAQVLNEMQETGYVGTELGDWNFMPTDPKALKPELDRRGLTMLAAFVPVMRKERAAHTPGAEVAVRTARLLAGVQGKTPFIVLADDNGKDPVRTKSAGRVAPNMGLSEAEWKIAAEGVQCVAEAVYR